MRGGAPDFGHGYKWISDRATTKPEERKSICPRSLGQLPRHERKFQQFNPSGTAIEWTDATCWAVYGGSINVDELKLEHNKKGNKFEVDAVRAGARLGAQDLGYSYIVVPPGKRVTPMGSNLAY